MLGKGVDRLMDCFTAKKQSTNRAGITFTLYISDISQCINIHIKVVKGDMIQLQQKNTG